MLRLTKKLDGKRIRIKATPESMDRGTVISGIYRHIPRKQSFEFEMEGQTPNAIFERDDWTLFRIEA